MEGAKYFFSRQATFVWKECLMWTVRNHWRLMKSPLSSRYRCTVPNVVWLSCRAWAAYTALRSLLCEPPSDHELVWSLGWQKVKWLHAKTLLITRVIAECDSYPHPECLPQKVKPLIHFPCKKKEKFPKSSFWIFSCFFPWKWINGFTFCGKHSGWGYESHSAIALVC